LIGTSKPAIPAAAHLTAHCARFTPLEPRHLEEGDTLDGESVLRAFAMPLAEVCHR